MSRDGICERADDVCFVFFFFVDSKVCIPQTSVVGHAPPVSGYLKPQFESTVTMKASWINHLAYIIYI